MKPSERRIVAACLIGGIVGGFTVGDSTSWAANLTRLVIVGGFTGVTAWCVLEGISMAIRGRR